jgi:hypothetical protein
MSKSKTENKGMFIIIIGLLFTSAGAMLLTKEGNEYLSLGLSILAVSVIIIGLVVILKGNTNKKLDN